MNSEASDKTSVLIVDDNPDNLNVLFDYLKESGFKTLVAEDGEEAINHAEHARPNIILLDIIMPGMDGFEACRCLKENASTKDIPIIFMTALSDVDNKVRGFELGAVDYVTKPFHREEVLSRITTHLTIQRQKKELEDALDKVRLLSGLLPICSACKKIRDDKGDWKHIETYIRDHSEADFAHSICPECARRLYPELYEA